MFYRTKNRFLISLILILPLTILGFLVFHKNDVSATNSTCTDSDGGKDYYTYGYVTTDGGHNNEWDSCAYDSDSDKHFLYENYCEDNQLKTKVYPCPDGCTEGACAKEERFITITSPNGGEELNDSETYNITWNSKGVDYIDISLIPKDDPVHTGDIAYNVPASLGKYSWKVSAYEGEYKIYIKDSSCSGGYWPSENLQDYSDEYFTIISNLSDVSNISFEVAQVEGFDVVPDIIPYNALFTVKWNVPGARYCDAGGYALPLSEEDSGAINDYVIENWPDLTLLPNSGTKTLYARVKTSDYVTPLTISLQCEGYKNIKELTVNVHSDELPLNQPASGTISVSSNKVEMDEQFTVSVKGYDSDGLDKLLVARPNVGWISRLAGGATSSEANFVFSESKPGIYYYDGDIIGTRPNGNRDQIRTNPHSVKVEVVEAGKEVINCAKEYGEEYWCGGYEDWQNECQGEGNTISLEQSNKVCKGTDWPLSYCVTCKNAPLEFYYPLDGAIIHTLNPQFVTKNIKEGKYYQLGIWEGKQILSENKFLTWINATQKEGETETSQEGPIGKFEWNQTYTAGIRRCEDDSFSDCGDWTDSVVFTIEPGDSVYESDNGKDYYTSGYVSVDGEMMTDYCLHEIRSSSTDKNTLIEYYVTGKDNNSVDSIHYSCPNGCKDGACTQEQEKSLKIIYPNNREKIQKGLINLIKWESQGIEKVNIELQKGDRVWHLADNVSASSGKYFWDVSTDFEDDSDYKLTIWDADDDTIKDSSDNYFRIVSVGCADTDNGDNSYEKGKVTCNGEFHEDFCNVNGKLVEWLCESGKATSFLNSCKNGCSEGKCLKKPSDEKININIWAKIQTNDVSGKHVKFFSDYHDTTTICEFMLIGPDGFMLGNGTGGCYDNLGEGFAAIPLENLKTHAERFDFQYAGTWTYRVYLPEYDQTVDTNFIITSGTSSDDEIVAGVCLPDGTLIKLPNNPKIYVIQSCKRKWIRTQEEFKKQGYKWEDVQEKPSNVVNAYADYLETQAKLLRAIGQHKVYRIIGNKRLWVPTISAFNAQGLKWEGIEDKPEAEVNQYPRAKLLKDKKKEGIYYITESGLRRQIPNNKVFNSYGNKWEDVVEVDKDIIESYEVCNLIKPENSYQIYKLEGNIKHWIKTADAFNRLKYNWSKVAPVNETEFNAYQEGNVIE